MNPSNWHNHAHWYNPVNPASPIWIARHAATRTAAQNAGTHQPLSPEEDFIMCIIILSTILIIGLAFFGYSIYKLWKEERELK